MLLKVVIIGDSHVGKTSIRNRYVLDKFSLKTRQTVGADFVSKDVTLPNGETTTLQLWDTAGQERFQSISAAYYRGADACVLIYDVTDPNSLANLVTWQRDFIHYAKIDNVASFPFIIIANKVDRTDSRQISPAQGVKAAQVLKDISVEIESPHTERYPFNNEANYDIMPPAKAVERRSFSNSFLGLKSMKSRMQREEIVHELDSFPKFKPTLSNKASAMSFYSATSQITSSSISISDNGSEDTITPGNISGEWIDTVNGHAYFECSAFTGEKIDKVFNYIASVAKPSLLPSNSFSLSYQDFREDQPRGFLASRYTCC